MRRVSEVRPLATEECCRVREPKSSESTFAAAQRALSIRRPHGFFQHRALARNDSLAGDLRHPRLAHRRKSRLPRRLVAAPLRAAREYHRHLGVRLLQVAGRKIEHLRMTALQANPWGRLPLESPWVLPEDRLAIDVFNASAGSSHRIHIETPPEPFLGPLDAPIVVLLLNPGTNGDGVHDHRLLDEPRGDAPERRHFYIGASNRWWVRVLDSSDHSSGQGASPLCC